MKNGMKVSDAILKLVPYKAGKPIAETQREYGVETVYKLASNENPLGPSPKALEALQKGAQELHRYPDPAGYELIRALSSAWGVPSQRLAIGNGSNEVIDLLIRIYCEPGEAILQTEAAFVAYAVCAQAARVKVVSAPLQFGLKTDLGAMAKILRERRESEKIRLIFVANPNNPTGTIASARDVAKYLEEFGNHPEVLTIFDEAYVEFVRSPEYKSVLSLMDQYKSIAVMRTFSKVYGLGGARIGVLAAQPAVIDLFNRVRNPFNINELGSRAATAALSDSEFVKKTLQLTWQGLDYFYAELKRLGLPFVPSEGNFVLFETKRDVKAVNEALLRRGIILRPVGNYGFPTLLRMSVGLPHENQAAIKALEAALNEVPELPPQQWTSTGRFA